MVERTPSGINYFDIDRLCAEAVDRNFKGDGNTIGPMIGDKTYATCWKALTQ